MDPHAEPLRPIGTVTRVQLEHYALGKLDAAERRRIELHLENDPLLREAMEGLALPGAVNGLAMLDAGRPGDSGSVWRLVLTGAIMVVGLAAIVLWVNEKPSAPPIPMAVLPVPDRPFRADSAIAVVQHELVQAMPVPPLQQIGHGPAHTARVVRTDTSIVRVIQPRTDSIPIAAPPPPAAPAPTTAAPRGPLGNRKLAYVHDLKLLDPKELYNKGPLIMETGGVPADVADGVERDRRNEAPRTMRYLDFMDVALDKFVRNDHRGCLEDLLFLMGQYPKDLNARFYAGLCCYNLGLQDRAMAYLTAVVADPIDTFREEAEWYLALTIERAEGPLAAHPMFVAVRDGGGTYAAKAAAKLEP